MASAAAVAADQALSPEPTNLNELDQNGATVTSAIVPADEDIPDDLNADEEDDEDDVVRSRPRGPQVNGGSEQYEEEELGDDDDLFGDGDGAEDEDAEAPTHRRTLDDADLDSGDDEDRADRIADEQGTQEVEYEQEQEQEQAVLEVSMARQPGPEPSDGELYLTKVPRFLAIDPKAWHQTTYQPPTMEHHSTAPAGPTFSPYNTALSTVHWRKSPSNPKEIQSNARILRWSDGTLTLQFASNPTQQFVIEGNPLAPRQSHPVKPTPVSRKANQLHKETGHDTFTYLVMPDPHNGLMRVCHKVTAGLSILPSAETTDEALEKLQTSLAAIAQGKNKNGGGIELVRIDEDPELAKKKAEVAEREKLRAQKRREAAEGRERERNNRTLGRSRGYGGGGLSASMLEDEETTGGRPRGNRPKQNRRQRRNSEYSDDEDFGHKRGNFANDEYDEEDEFIARSDEEEEAIVDSDSDDGIVNEPAGRKKSTTKASKRPSPDADEEDAEGEDEEEEIVQSSRVKRRRVIDDDDEE